MSTSNKWAKAGLVFVTDRRFDIQKVAADVVKSTKTLGLRVTGSHILSDDRALVTAAGYELYLSIQNDKSLDGLNAPAPVYLDVAITRGRQIDSTTFARDSILARVLQTLFKSMQPDFVKWMGSQVLLPGSDFARAVSDDDDTGTDGDAKVTPRRIVSRKSLPDVDATNTDLQSRISNQDPAIFDDHDASDRLREIFADNYVNPNVEAKKAADAAIERENEDIERAAPLRLSAWILSFAVALFALPVGIVLLILNFAKGENLRLASQTAALTGTFIAFQTYGTMANAMTTVQKIIN